jgi:hypothetical protein
MERRVTLRENQKEGSWKKEKVEESDESDARRTKGKRNSEEGVTLF